MPDIGTTVETVTLVSWLKNEGDSVARGEPLCEVETDKAVSDPEGRIILIKKICYNVEAAGTNMAGNV